MVISSILNIFIRSAYFILCSSNRLIHLKICSSNKKDHLFISLTLSFSKKLNYKFNFFRVEKDYIVRNNSFQYIGREF